MRREAQPHNSIFGIAWNSVLALMLVLLVLIVVVLFIVFTAQPAHAQNSVPATARQAATMPQFASRLAQNAQRASRVPQQSRPKASYQSPYDRRSGRQDGWLPDDNVVYTNGAINGTTDAWEINFGFAVSNTFTVPSGGNSITGMIFGAWLFPGDVVQSVEVLIGTSEYGSTIADQVVSFSQSNCSGNQYGFNVCTETGNFTTVNLAGGTYWVTLENAVVNTGDPVYWDENSGPSSASENSVGTIPSEAFTIVGEGHTCASGPISDEALFPEAKETQSPPTQTFRVIYNFTGGVDGASPHGGLTIDAAGNLYGTTGNGGSNGSGTVFKLTPNGSDWHFSSLYSFSGPDGAGPDGNVIIARDGTLYGATYGGGLGNGGLFRMSPSGHISPNAFSTWIERMFYGFTGGTDGANPQGNIVLDDAGNVYGTAFSGGTYGKGTLYELTNQGIHVLHAFGSFDGDGLWPTGVARGGDGLYGVTSAGGSYHAGTLYTLAGGYQILYHFSGDLYDGNPLSVTSDQAGNVYGTAHSYVFSSCFGPLGGGSVFRLSYPDRQLQYIASWNYRPATVLSWVTADAAGNIYGTTDNQGGYGLGNVFEVADTGGYTSLHDFSGVPTDGATPAAAPVVDAHGNIFGTTQDGGAYGSGVVWEISP